MAGFRANQRLAMKALRGAGLFGAGTAVGARLATVGHFPERLGDDLLRAAEKHARAAPTAPG